jgi:hypothetical protein
MEKLLKKEVKYQWNDECQKSLDTLKQKMVTAPILVFPNWSKGISCTCGCIVDSIRSSFGTTGEGEIDHLIAFTNRKLSSTEKNYTMTE